MDPKHTHAHEQARAALVEHASTMWSYFEHLTAQGFTRAEALRLVEGYQGALLGTVFRRPES